MASHGAGAPSRLHRTSAAKAPHDDAYTSSPPSSPGSRLAIAAIITVAFGGSVIVSPLYPLFQAQFGFSEIVLTLIYAVYVVGNVGALLFFGQVSDQIGRKCAALPALALAAAGGLLFLAASSTVWLFAGRALSGLAVGVASGTGTAWLAEEYGAARRSTATLAATTANLAGITIGPLAGGLLGQYAPWPLKLPFVVYIGAIGIVAVVIVRVRETRPPASRGISEVRLVPRIGVPRRLLGAFTPPAVTGFVIFALAGFYFALIPGIVLDDLHETNIAISGGVVSELGLVAAATIVLGRRLRPDVAMTGGLVLLAPAVALVVSAQAAQSSSLLLLASALAGVSLGLGYRGSLQVVNQIAPDERRAEVVSSYYVACFVGNSVPVIGLGLLASMTSAVIASIVFACVLAALATGALLWRRHHAT